MRGTLSAPRSSSIRSRGSSQRMRYARDQVGTAIGPIAQVAFGASGHRHAGVEVCDAVCAAVVVNVAS